MKKNKLSKLLAIIALFWIIIWIVWTWILIIFSPTVSSPTIENNQIDLSDYISSWTIAPTESLSWVIDFPKWTLDELNNSWVINSSWTTNISVTSTSSLDE